MHFKLTEITFQTCTVHGVKRHSYVMRCDKSVGLGSISTYIIFGSPEISVTGTKRN
jgi:hypothetical protein